MAQAPSAQHNLDGRIRQYGPSPPHWAGSGDLVDSLRGGDYGEGSKLPGEKTNFEKMASPTPFTTRAEAIAYLYGRVDFEREAAIPYQDVNFSLARTRAVCAELGDPHLGRATIHVAGSKGKGSTSAMIAQAFREAGYRVGLYSSPHLLRVEERIAIDGEPCDGELFLSVLNEVAAVVALLDARSFEQPDHVGRPTFFEILTAMAFVAFARVQVDLVILEVGLGGRLDSTNICQPICSVITSISKDHMLQLGDTLAKIAGEKAGIIKPGVPVVSGVTEDEPAKVIARIAQERGSELLRMETDFGYVSRLDPRESELVRRLTCFYWDRRETPLADLCPRLLGRHQHANAAVALATLRRVRADPLAQGRPAWKLPDEAIRRGIEAATCRGRMEIVQREPWVILDTAHNGASMRALVQTVDDYWPRGPECRRILVLAVTRGKDLEEIVSPLIPAFDTILVTKYHLNPRGEEAQALGEFLMRRMETSNPRPVPALQIYPSPRDAWQRAIELARPRDLICVTGSFYLAGEMVALWDATTREAGS